MPVKPNPDHRLNKPFLTPIVDIVQENKDTKTFIIDYNPIPEEIEIHPGQFVMVWIPGIDEIPMSVSHVGWDSRITISVTDVGEATNALHKLIVGDKIGIRGPYGNRYKIMDGLSIIVGGGVGMASVLPLIRQIANFQKTDKDSNVNIKKLICIQGVNTKSKLMFVDEINSIMDNKNFEICTDDGSLGFKGFTTSKLENILNRELKEQETKTKKIPITVYACGPEIMLKKILGICETYNCGYQASLERMMRCGFGLCGLCALEPTGMLVCKDGPIFNKEELKKTTDFGNFQREFSGRVTKI